MPDSKNDNDVQGIRGSSFVEAAILRALPLWSVRKQKEKRSGITTAGNRSLFLC